MYFVVAGTYVDTAVITRPNVRVYGQTGVPGSYSRNSEHTPMFMVSISCNKRLF